MTNEATRTAPARTYRVLYAVTRGEYYEIEATTPEAAEDTAFTDGQCVDSGETTDVVPYDVEEIAVFSPSRPEPTNDDRAAWAAAALRHFQSITGADDADALGDLLSNLLHWSACNGCDFDAALARAWRHYAAETAPQPANA